MSFWESLSVPWQAALTEAWTAYRAGSLPIGAVILQDNQIVARGRNRIAEVHEVNIFISGTQVSHAELNAIVQLRGDADTSILELYTTMEPCPLCVGAIAMSSLKTVHFAARDAWAGSTGILKENIYLAGKNIRLHPPSNPILEVLCSAWVLQSDLQWRGDTPENNFVRRFETEQPNVVRLARELHTGGQLERLRREAGTVWEAVNLTTGRLEGNA